eukprot:TRINITY_DN73971_c0_g1_i1.p1 TRINITY_DN73971_c0_g1~~TRINITY_DN73971_c0_g1_i1.p1  ORF type:complete len:496 (+),score=84.57 TRINITY_DN73971_c0_g1_i1:46-1533(+)
MYHLGHAHGQAQPLQHPGVGPAAEGGLISNALDLLSSNFYFAAVLPLFLVTAVFSWYTRPRTKEALSETFLAHQRTYLIVWYLAVSADWLQGPYVYALYAAYGYQQDEIAKLFVAGFGASMVFGTFVGSLADRYGRKRCAILYCICYALSCMTKHVNLYAVLMLGRIFGGIATSLLYSTFECWLVAEHVERMRFSPGLLRYTFGLMFFGMYFVAILAGFASEGLRHLSELQPLTAGGVLHVGGLLAPFDLSLAMLLLCLVPITLYWNENYGSADSSGSITDAFRNTVRSFAVDPSVGIIGAIVACFEGSMFAFVFHWTPALESEVLPPPHGLIFSLFMMACMCGSSAFSLTDPQIRPAIVLVPTLCVAAASLMVVTFFLRDEQQLSTIFYAFLMFEFCVGVYFPAMGTLKSAVVPELARAGVYNVYRIPLNAIVCGLLLSNMGPQKCFRICGSAIMVGLVFLLWHLRLSPIGKDLFPAASAGGEGQEERVAGKAE